VVPADLAYTAYAAGKWFEGEDFGPALIIPERNGPGGEFVTQLVKKYRYPNVYVESRGKNKKEIKYGWHKDGRGEDAEIAFGLHRSFLMDGTFVERSRYCVDEMRHYQHPPGGKGAPVHSAALRTEDPSGARENHGDRVITRVVICRVLDEWQKEPPESVGEPLRGSYEWFELKRGEKRNHLQKI
jgi:hypothetical protein